MRAYIGDGIQIDGRMIGYRLVTARDYLNAKGMTEEEVEDFAENKYSLYQTISQIMAIKQSCWLLRRTSYSCQSLSDSLYSLKNRLIRELEANGFEFDDEFVERNGESQKHCKTCGKPMIVCYDGSVRHGTYYHYNQKADCDHTAFNEN